MFLHYNTILHIGWQKRLVTMIAILMIVHWLPTEYQQSVIQFYNLMTLSLLSFKSPGFLGAKQELFFSVSAYRTLAAIHLDYIFGSCTMLTKVKIEVNVPSNSQGHNGMGPQLCHLWESYPQRYHSL